MQKPLLTRIRRGMAVGYTCGIVAVTASQARIWMDSFAFRAIAEPRVANAKTGDIVLGMFALRDWSERRTLEIHPDLYRDLYGG